MNKIQFSGLYRFYTQKPQLEVLRECHQPPPKPLRHRLQGKMDDVAFHEPAGDGFFSVPLQAIKEIPEGREPGYQGAMITAADLEDFWFAFAPDVFTPEVRGKAQQLWSIYEEKRQAVKTHLDSRHQTEVPDNKKKYALKEKIPFAEALTPRFLCKKARADKSFKAQYDELEADASKAKLEYKRYCKPLAEQAHQVRKNDPARFEAAVFDFVETHPTDSKGQARKAIQV